MNETKIQNLTIKIEQDPEPSNPRTEHDCAATMVCWHRRYDLGDKHKFSCPDDFMISLADEMKPTDAERSNEESYQIVKELAVILPLYLYDHSSITMRCEPYPCHWDSCQVGYIYMTLQNARDNWLLSGATWETELEGWGENKGKQITLRAAAERLMRAEVSEYDQYLTGDVWGYEIEDENGSRLDSCYGYFGREYCETEAREATERCLKSCAAEKIEREAMECRDIVTV